MQLVGWAKFRELLSGNSQTFYVTFCNNGSIISN